MDFLIIKIIVWLIVIIEVRKKSKEFKERLTLKEQELDALGVKCQKLQQELQQERATLQ